MLARDAARRRGSEAWAASRARWPGVRRRSRGVAQRGAQSLDRPRYDAPPARRAAHLAGMDWLPLECVRRRTPGNGKAGRRGECVRDLVVLAPAMFLVLHLTADVGKR